MAINYVTGNLLEAPVDALVNTVNTEGVMGKGIALTFVYSSLDSSGGKFNSRARCCNGSSWCLVLERP